QAIMNVNINQSSTDDDDDNVSEESFELENTLNLLNSLFLMEKNQQFEANIIDDNDAGSSNWLEELN
ncbi:23166_t:CDS:1, partial [Cetraspora pellucida]